MCPECSKPVKSCVCKQRRKTVPAGGSPGSVRVLFETKGRKGKAVTIIAGLKMSEEQMVQYAKELKQKLGTGGSVKDGAIELQGDQREKLAGVLGRG